MASTATPSTPPISRIVLVAPDAWPASSRPHRAQHGVRGRREHERHPVPAITKPGQTPVRHVGGAHRGELRSAPTGARGRRPSGAASRCGPTARPRSEPRRSASRPRQRPQPGLERRVALGRPGRTATAGRSSRTAEEHREGRGVGGREARFRKNRIGSIGAARALPREERGEQHRPTASEATTSRSSSRARGGGRCRTRGRAGRRSRARAPAGRACGWPVTLAEAARANGTRRARRARSARRSSARRSRPRPRRRPPGRARRRGPTPRTRCRARVPRFLAGEGVAQERERQRRDPPLRRALQRACGDQRLVLGGGAPRPPRRA